MYALEELAEDLPKVLGTAERGAPSSTASSSVIAMAFCIVGMVSLFMGRFRGTRQHRVASSERTMRSGEQGLFKVILPGTGRAVTCEEPVA